MGEVILAVDDNLVELQQLAAQLGGKYKVIPAKSGEQALAIAANILPDIILLDVDMPGMDGYATLELMQANTRLRHIPVIFLTGKTDPELEVRALEAGAKDFLLKPFERSILIHRLDLHLRLSQYQRDLQQTVKELEDSIAVSFAELIEFRDKSTGGHVQRTGEYVAILGYALRAKGYFSDELQDRELNMMVRAAPLHDIGKIGVSDIVLLKPGKLSDEEFAIMKEHTVIGAAILGTMFQRLPTQEYLHYAQMIAQSHHERFDGKGYPYGQTGEDIPLCARIMAVADVYDALVADRVYRKAMTDEEACDIIIAGKGANFDPRVVEIFEEYRDIFRNRREEPGTPMENVLTLFR
ncbi:MAG: putative cyclic di-GMP phosphodiesterase [Desulfovibrio sp.]